MNRIKYSVKLFAGARSLVGADTLELCVESGASVRDLQEAMLRAAPTLQQLPAFRLAVDQQYAAEHHLLQGGEEIACIPPVSGG